MPSENHELATISPQPRTVSFAKASEYLLLMILATTIGSDHRDCDVVVGGRIFGGGAAGGESFK